jgi:GT2 family glycosyltransferase
MASEQKPALDLIPQSGVDIVDGRMVASSLPVWLALHPLGAAVRGRWLRLRYSSSLYDENVRPLIRMTGAEGVSIEPMNGALHGVGEWIGRVPDDVSKIEISPVTKTGPFEFRLDRVQRISAARLALRGLFAKPRWVLWAIQTALGGAREDARRALLFASEPCALAKYHRWCRRMSRALDRMGLDRPRVHWERGPAFRLFMVLPKDAAPHLAATLQSLRSQAYPHWSLHFVFDQACADADRQALRRLLDNDERIHEMTFDTGLTGFRSDRSRQPGGDICSLIKAGDTLPDYALAALAEARRTNPDAVLFYGDEESISVSGRLHSPRLLPDWSPLFQDYSSYLGETMWIDADKLAAAGVTTIGQWSAAKDNILAKIAAGCESTAVCHVRRVLYRHLAEDAREQSTESHRASIKPRRTEQPPAVRVIVPTRDNPEFLSQCISGLTQATDYPNFNVTVVNNGSARADTLALLRDIVRHPRIDVLDRPGSFNFSALCNDAARNSKEPILLFLNDDIAVIEPGWMSPLVDWALRPNVGAAGAKLLFPDGTIQHAGVTLGLGGIAGHMYRRTPARRSGYLRQLTAAREVSAVTAACMAVERRKFEKAGGFDAEHLPVELNDVDLCLRLAEEGYATVWTPQSVLTHHESATRGDSAWSSREYQKQRQYFVTEWQEAIRGDRYFHPSLSLFSYEPQLASGGRVSSRLSR